MNLRNCPSCDAVCSPGPDGHMCAADHYRCKSCGCKWDMWDGPDGPKTRMNRLTPDMAEVHKAKPSGPRLYNRLMASLADRLEAAARYCKGESLRYGPLFAKSKKVFGRVGSTRLEYVDAPEMDRRLKLGVSRLAEVEEAALARGVERGKAALEAIKDEQLRAQAQYEIEQAIAKDPSRFAVKHDPDDSLEA